MSDTPAVLVLEDDENMRDMIVEILEEFGYIAHGAENAEAAIELAKQIPIDLAIADVRMAGRLDGIGALEVLKKRNPSLRCIIITGYASDSAPTRAARIQVDDYLHKPFALSVLLELVTRTLRKSQERSSYTQLLRGLWAGPQKLWDAVDQRRSQALLDDLDGVREQVLDGYFVKIRGKDQSLSKGAALDLWDRLESLELHYLMLVHHLKEFNSQFVESMLAEYRAARDWLTALSQSQSFGSMKARGPEQVDRSTFSQFYDAIQSGKISSEQLKVAAPVRRSDPARRSAEAQSLYQLMWA